MNNVFFSEMFKILFCSFLESSIIFSCNHIAIHVAKTKKQPPRGVPRKSYSENMQQIYGRTPMPKCDFNRSNFIEITLRDGCSPVNLLHIFRTPFPRDTSGWLLLIYVVSSEKDGWGTGKKKQIKFSPYSGTKALILRIY